ncbi:MAG: inorganic diphosphatase [Chloroflexota bacterium]|nr:inorganic diphosphatase [Chloroflexota bacterium]MDE3101846.1 inorganic diphosphatase [Chloroflexota bacterium]
MASVADRTVEVLIEIPRGSRSKYEIDERTGRLRLDRVLYSSVHYPTDYGFILDTLALDGDHLDVLLLCEEPAVPGSLQTARPIGLLEMEDEKGPDEKVLAVPTGDPRFSDVRSLDDLARHWRVEIQTFFDSYKTLEGGKGATVRGWRGVDAAWRAVEEARRRFDATPTSRS